MSWTVYCHTHVESGRRYVGLTSQTMERRWATHVSKSKSSRDGRWHFPNAIRKYGKDAFSHEVLRICASLEEANAYEAYFIDLFRTRDARFGFNLAEGGRHEPHPIRKNPWDDPEYRAKNLPRFVASGQTQEARARNREAFRTPEFREAQSRRSKATMARPEVRNKVIKQLTGRKATPQTLAKMSMASASRKPSMETKKKISLALLGRTHPGHGRPCTDSEKEKLSRIIRTYVIENGVVVSKLCKKHGVLTAGEFTVSFFTRGTPRVECKRCKMERDARR